MAVPTGLVDTRATGERAGAEDVKGSNRRSTDWELVVVVVVGLPEGSGSGALWKLEKSPKSDSPRRLDGEVVAACVVEAAAGGTLAELKSANKLK